MHRLLFASLPWILACASATPHPAPAAAPPGYALVPFTSLIVDNPDAAYHLSANVAGTLDITGDRAKLALAFDGFVEHTGCRTAPLAASTPAPSAMGFVASSAAAASAPMMTPCGNSAKLDRPRATLTLSGDVHHEGELIRANVRDATHAVGLACSPDAMGLRCTFDDPSHVLGEARVPRELTLQRGGLVRWDVTPFDAPAIGRVGGGIEMRGGDVEVALWADRGGPVYLKGTVRATADGLAVAAKASQDHWLTATCTVEVDRLACEFIVARGVLGKPDPITAKVVLRARG